MSSVECLREFINQRLTAAAEEIFRFFQKTVVEYEEEISRQRRLLDIVWKPEIKLHRIEPNSDDQVHVSKSQDHKGGKQGDSRSTRNVEPKPKKKLNKSKNHTNNEENSTTLKNHSNTYTREKSLKCNTCGKVHTGEKPYPCNTCEKRFSEPRTLKVHMGIHTVLTVKPVKLIDPSTEEEEKVCSLSQPSIQLQCAEDWTSNGGDNHSPCHDALPPPSSLPSRSPSPSPPSRREESLRSSLTLQSAEPFITPIHHSLSISHGNSPLLLSHHVSLGLTTVAVDVHFYPAATASMAVDTSTHISSVPNSTAVAAPLFSPPLSNSVENDQSTARLHQCK
ncbi:hypothetical protein PAMP_021927 [Pampus punctatissimus]